VGSAGQNKRPDLGEPDALQRPAKWFGVMSPHGDDFEGVEVRKDCQAPGEGLEYSLCPIAR